MVEVTIHDKNLRDALIDRWEDLPEEAIDELLATHRIEAAKAERGRLQQKIETLGAALRDAKSKAEYLHSEIGRFGYGRLQRAAWEHVEALADALESQT